MFGKTLINSKVFFTFIFVFASLIVFSQETEKIKGSYWGNTEGAKKTFVVLNLKEKLAKHKTIAILPIKSYIRYKKTPKDFNAELNKENENKMSFELQTSMYDYLIVNIDNYSVQIQNIDSTNFILKENKMIDSITQFKPQDVAKVLGVDAVIFSNYTYTKLGSELGAIVSELLIGGGKVATGQLNMDIINGSDGEVLWGFNKTMNQDNLSSPEAIIRRMMSKVGRNFPYLK